MLTISMASPTPHFAPAHKRPKLSLQTNAFAATGISAVTATPTTLNTFNNTYELAHRPSPSSHLAPLTSRLSRSQSPRPTRRADRPYHVPYGVKSILKNSEVPAFATASPSTGTRKVFFPQAKKVGFKLHLEEEIVNKIYTAKHSDLVWGQDDVDVMESVETESEAATSTNDTAERSTLSISTKSTKARRDSGVSFSFTETRKVEAKPSLAINSQSSKKRRWEWTLSPIRPTFQEDVIDTSGLDSEWVVVSIQRERSEESIDQPVRPTKRRAASVEAGEGAAAKRRLLRTPVRSNTL